jgi:hypothetical protein
MNGFRVTFAGATLALAVTVASSVAGPVPRIKCNDASRDQAQREECISPTFPNQDRGPCAKGACYRSGIQKHKKAKKTTS